MSDGDHRPYRDRLEAGEVLAAELARYAGRPDLLVLALPRGGVPVAGRVAERLAAPLDVLLVRKIGLPWQPELAMGAVAAVGGRTELVRNPEVLAGISEEEFQAACQHERAVLSQRELAYRGDRKPVELAGRTVIVVDDGLATGATMRAALAALRPAGVARLVLAVPIAPRATCLELADQVDGLVCPWQPVRFVAVSQGYRRFDQTTDSEVINILAANAGRADDH